MYRTDAPNATAAGLYRQGNPFASIGGTEVLARWLNAVQEEIAGVIESEGIVLDADDTSQLRQAIAARVDALIELRIGASYTFDAPYDVQPGDGVLVVDVFGAAEAAATTGNPVSLVILGEVDLEKEVGTGLEWTPGRAVFWDDANRRATVNGSGRHLIGYATLAAGELATAGRVRLNGIAAPVL